MLVVQKLPHFYGFQEVIISTKSGNDRKAEKKQEERVWEEKKEHKVKMTW